MASLERRGRKFRIIFCHGGSKHQVSLDTEDRDEALTKKKRLEANLAEVELGRITVPLGVDLGVFLLTDGKTAKRQVVEKALTLREFFDEYRAHLPEGAKEGSTRYTEDIHIEHLLRLIGPDTPVKLVTNDTLQRYATARSGESSKFKRLISHVTIKKEIGTLAAVWNKWALPKGKVDGPAPTKGLSFTKRRGTPPFQTWEQIERKVAGGESPDLWDSLFMDVSEVAELVAFVKGKGRPWFHAMMAVAAHTGARRSELIRSRLEDFDFERETVTIREKKRDRGTEMTFRHVPMSPLLKSVMLEWKKNHPGGRFSFCIHADKRLTVQTVAKQFRRALDGTEWAPVPGWHCLRHSFISNLAAEGIDQRVIDGFVGHTTEAMRRRYTHLFPGVAKRAVLTVFGAGS